MYPDPAFVAAVGAFQLDRFEVTVGRFRQFVVAGTAVQARPPAAGSGAHDAIAGSGWDPAWNTRLAADRAALASALECDPTHQTWTSTAASNEILPINCATWFEAMAFCAWDGGYLPTEAEWNFAASGGEEHRAYPWSSPSDSLAIDGTYYHGASQPGPVGGKPAGDGPWGHADLAGNLNERTLDAAITPLPLPCIDCANLSPSPSLSRVLRGGSHAFGVGNVRAARRFTSVGPASRAPHEGFRCAWPSSTP
jgi:formylglycine-generating enzyme required for sulfatase activity